MILELLVAASTCFGALHPFNIHSENEFLKPPIVMIMQKHRSDKFIDFVRSFEGFRPRRYWDHKQWSIGYGSKAKPGEHVISEEDAKQRLAQEIQKSRDATKEFAQRHGYKWRGHQLDAMTSFHYNIGSLNQLTNTGKRDDKEIAVKLPLYVKAGGVTASGLVKRRKAEQKLFLRGYD